MAKHNLLGEKGEKLAKEFLVSKGYHILHTNWVFEKVEIDIVAENEDVLVCVEVKTRSTDYFGYPEEAVTKTKQDNLLNAMDAYLEEHPIDKEIRYDIVSIIVTSSEIKIYHIEDAISPYMD